MEKQKQSSLDESWEKIRKKLEEPGTEIIEEYPPIHNFFEEPEILGVVENIRNITTTVGPATICDLTRADNKELVSFWLTTVLHTQFQKLKIEPGHQIGIKFLGKPKGKKYYNYRVVTL